MERSRHVPDVFADRRRPATPLPKRTAIKITIRLPRRIQKPAQRLESRFQRLAPWKRAVSAVAILVVVAVLLLNIPLPIFGSYWQNNAYALSAADKQVISQPNASMAAVLQHDSAQQTYNFNANYRNTDPNNQTSGGGPKIQATLHDDLSKGVTVTDPTNQVDFTMTPQIQALAAKQVKNQLIYPIFMGNADLVYTANAFGVKEDLLLHHSLGDMVSFQYKMGLGDTYAAKLLDDGSIGVFGSDNSALNNATAGDAKDQALLQKARQHAPKTKLLFTIPVPAIIASGSRQGQATAKYGLKGNLLTVTASHLKSAAYPLSIDPTVQIASASQDVRGTSVESNADFDLTNNQITRGAISGGTTGTWTATATMNQARFLGASTAYNGVMYVVGGAGTSGSTTNIAGTNTNMVEMSTIGTGSPATLGTWSAGNHIGLPAGGLSRFQLIGYHGFLYAIGGSTTDTTCTTVSSTVYYASVQVNGVLGNWQTTNAPSTARCSFGAAAYGGKIYIAGGKTGAASTTGTTDVSYAVVNPDGTLTWTSGTTPALPAARYGNDLQAYNGYLYVVGGSLNGTLTNTVLYAALNTNGTIFAGSWTSTNTFATARENLGSQFSVIHNGYIYLSGGCSALNANQTCTTPQGDTQLAQINADGSLGQWATTTTLVANRVGATEAIWRGTVYNLAGCLAMSTTVIGCNTTPVATTQYGTIDVAGQASVLKNGTNLTVSLFGASAAVLNGYLYVVGGCITASCQTGVTGTGNSDTSNQTYYAQIGTDGTLGTWQNNSANAINGLNSTNGFGLAETALVAANGSLFAFGGYNHSGPLQKAFVVTPSPSTGALPGVWSTPTNGTNTNILPATAYGASVLYTDGSFLVFGGCIAATGSFGCSTYRQTVSRITYNGTTFSAVTALTAIPTSANYPNAVMGLAYYYGYVYLCGGAAAAQGQTQECAYDNVIATTSTPTLGATWHLTTGLLNVGTSPDHPIRRNAAYASNGYLYVYAGHDGANNVSVGDIDIGKIDPSTGNVASNFTISTTTFTPKWDTASAFADGNIYTVGGCVAGSPPTSCTSGTGPSNKTEYFQIYNATNSGTRNVVSGTAYPNTYLGTQAVAYNGYLYTAGGCNSYNVSTQNCSGAAQNTYFMALNPDGSMAGAWSSGPNLVAARALGCMVALNGTLYYIAGTSSGPAQQDVYFSTASGASWGSGTWTAVNGGSTTGMLPVAKEGISCATWNDRIYVTGGTTSTNTNNATNVTYYSQSLPSGGDITSAWSTATSTFTTARTYHDTVAIGGYLYVIGGINGSTYLSDVQFAQISSSGDITSAWKFTNDIPLKEQMMVAYAANGYIYVMGGATGTASTSCLNSTYVAAVDSDGTLGAWTQGVATSFTAIQAPALAYYNGYYYIIGGNNCSTQVTTVSYAGEQSQAIRSIFTRYIDLVGDATPWKFVVNGTDEVINSVTIDNWSMTYSSSRIATNAFGQTTTLSPLQYGANPVAITAIDGSGTNQGVSRYWLLAYNIDQADSFTFADTTSPPAIISYSFYYAPSGNTRLRNGGIFQDQTNQSLDAHP